MNVTRFWHLLWRLAVLSVMLPAGVVPFVFAGYGSTWLLVSDGLDHLAGVERAAAQEALLMGTIGYLDHPFARAITPRLRVVGMQFDSKCHVPDLPRKNYQVHIQLYTFFLLPTRRIVVRCNGVRLRREKERNPPRNGPFNNSRDGWRTEPLPGPPERILLCPSQERRA